MVVVFPFHSGDARLLLQLLKWVTKLGPNPNHDALLVADGACNYSVVQEILAETRKSFRHVGLKAIEPVSGWIPGSNALFRTAAESLAGQPFLFIEPDATPLKPAWLDEIAAEYANCGKPFMGAVITHQMPNLPNPYLEGCAVYPPNAWEIMRSTFNSAQSWTLACCSSVVPLAYKSRLFLHCWGQPNLAPTFVPEKTTQSPMNAFTVSELNPAGVLQHRCKDGSLIRLLEKNMFPNACQKIAVVFPVCGMDFQLAVHHARWLLQMETKWDHDAVISFDHSVPLPSIKQFQKMLQHRFRSVDLFRYECPHRSYPAAANTAWQRTAWHMLHRGAPWFWCEADMIALRGDWIEQLQAEYERCGKAWMGSVVHQLGHLQGTAVYPADAATRMPRAMQAVDQAFDMEGATETAHSMHDAGHLLFHVWTLVDGNACPVGGGSLPVSITADQLKRWLPKTAVTLHRVKDDSVVSLLISGQYRH